MTMTEKAAFSTSPNKVSGCPVSFDRKDFSGKLKLSGHAVEPKKPFDLLIFFHVVTV